MAEITKNIALIGLGYWGKNILRNLHEMGVLNTACDLNARTVEERQQAFPKVEYTTSVDDILANPSVEAVVIASPAVTHFDLARQCLAAGKDVLVEKPLALHAAEGEVLVEEARRSGRVLMVGHVLQYHPAVIKLKEMIVSGELGKVQYIYSNRLNIGKLRTEENILWSFAPHDISVILSLLDAEPARVAAFGEDYLNPGIFDTTMTHLDFAGGVKAHIFVSWLHPFKEQKLVVVGSKGMVVFDDVIDEKLKLYSHDITWENGKIPVAHKADHVNVPIPKGEPLRAELDHFVRCVAERLTPRTDGEEGLRVLRVLEAAQDYLTGTVEKPAQAKTEKPTYFCHETAIVDKGVEIGEGTKVWHFSHLLSGTTLGKNCVLGQNCMVGPDVSLGNGCKVQNNVSLYKGVTLEENVFCGPSCVFTNVYAPRAFVERKDEFLPTRVKKGASVGANATVLCGNTIGKYALIAAGAVVKSDVADYAIVAGVPARRVGWVCKCGDPLRMIEHRGECRRCGSEYLQEGDQLTVTQEGNC